MRTRGSRSGEAGVSLIEILVAITILSIAAAAILGAVSTIAITSRGHNDQARAESVVTTAAERVRDPLVAHMPCATPSTPTYLAAARSAPVPSGWDANSAITIISVDYWNGDTFGGPCLDDDAHDHLLTLQLVTVQVTSPDGRAVESVSVVKAPRA
jgi:prepilin-type N-terminal cleavage/methylation domain-containing protein